ncbi:DUF5050 domain-containing protein [Clostridium lundense]|uniref:DUF5050 domain-containing protein n=1 Tax=Clostridium lundense TaxID=319475 RepID=UPI00068706C7|nr:DUF5050 domain-containing protein [Clostridium lundense]
MKNKFLIATFFSVFLLFSTNVQAANFTDNQTVDSNKTWTVTFTDNVGFDDLTKQGIVVTDSKCNPVNVGIQLGQDSKTVTVTAPKGGYIAGESYILNVGTKIHSNKGKALENEYKVHFSIKNDTINNDIVTFKDKELEQTVRNAINKPIGDIYKSDVEKITELIVETKGIQDISGIENLINLQILSLHINEISDISPLKELTNLQRLGLGENKISDISPLKGLTNLQRLNLCNNRINDISELKNLTNLQELNLEGNSMSDISALKGLTNLQNLYLNYNYILKNTSATITKINNISIDVNQNDNYTLPTTVTAIMSDTSSKSVSVVWDSNVVDTSKVGTFTFQGTAQGYSNKVKLILNVAVPGIDGQIGDTAYGFWAQKDGWIYYNSMDNGVRKLYKMKLDGTGRTKISDDTDCYNINILGDWIYYVAKGHIYKVKTDGTGKALVNGINGYECSPVVVNNGIYFHGQGGDTGHLYKIRTDGTQRTMISSDNALYKIVVGGWIYYERQYISGKRELYKIKIDGTQKTKLSDDDANSINVVGEWIYYSNISDNGSLYKIKTDGTQRTKVSNQPLSNINIIGEWIYYRNKVDGKLYKMKIDGSNNIKLSDNIINYTYSLYIIGDWIYYIDASDNDNLYKIKTDGTGEQIVN